MARIWVMKEKLNIHVTDDIIMVRKNTGGIQMPVLTNYVLSAMSEATYRILDDGSFYGEIKKCPGVWANETSLEKCRLDLQEVLEEWLLLKLRDRDPLPQLGGIDLNKAVAEA